MNRKTANKTRKETEKKECRSDVATADNLLSKWKPKERKISFE